MKQFLNYESFMKYEEEHGFCNIVLESSINLACLFCFNNNKSIKGSVENFFKDKK